MPTTLKEALRAWQQRESPDDDHIPMPALYEFFVHPEKVENRERILAHVTRCPACLTEFERVIDSAQAADRMAHWDFALSRAAASETSAPQSISTRTGMYILEIRPHLSSPNRGIITAQVAPAHREELEGKRLTVTDSRGRRILSGKIINGEASEEIDDLDQIEYGLIVRAE